MKTKTAKILGCSTNLRRRWDREAPPNAFCEGVCRSEAEIPDAFP